MYVYTENKNSYDARLPGNDIFAENAWYFRNAFVRANYMNLQKNIHETTEYLEVFLKDLILNEKNKLHDQNLHVSGCYKEEK